MDPAIHPDQPLLVGSSCKCVLSLVVLATAQLNNNLWGCRSHEMKGGGRFASGAGLGNLN